MDGWGRYLEVPLHIGFGWRASLDADVRPNKPSASASRSDCYDSIPAALIGRLARDEKMRGKGIGELLLADAVRSILTASKTLAVFAILVDAKDEPLQNSILPMVFSLFRCSLSASFS